jgi:hypothetical protein
LEIPAITLAVSGFYLFFKLELNLPNLRPLVVLFISGVANISDSSDSKVLSTEDIKSNLKIYSTISKKIKIICNPFQKIT